MAYNFTQKWLLNRKTNIPLLSYRKSEQQVEASIFLDRNDKIITFFNLKNFSLNIFRGIFEVNDSYANYVSKY